MCPIRSIISLVVIIFFLSCKNECDGSISQKDELLTSLELFNKTFKEGDAEKLSTMITDDYVHTNGSSKAIGKKGWLTYLKKREQDITSGNLEVIDYEMNDISVQYYCNSAIVTAKVKVKTKNDSGIKESQFRVTNLWVYESGNWLRAAFHDGKIK
ncbi:hypothetical protein MTsPCn9_07770 [Croceitalea sp. MTPC9]|uniref:nuclear transport factor 2 family protein n=1 Tax=unclassified Croceitalea TaxID=2632280 RepID=UPI002B37A7FE|nr:hypothetical protein MTsPCn6_00940 [Croceitalea sp. MTPC6]GMN15841.1 hypothetical protein MTsPCn9_07770 [Croceitalea sp. MTPC9]